MAASRRPKTIWAVLLLALISALALTGILLFVFQERYRTRILTEYRAFQLASELVQTLDSGELSLIPQVQDLLAFGVYTLWGEALYHFGEAPEHIERSSMEDSLQIAGDRVSLSHFYGGAAMMRGRMRADRPMGTPLARYVVLQYRANSLGYREYVLYGGAALVALALLMAFIGFLRLAVNLEAYRTREGRNRQLVALGEAARTLSHEIKNPLGVLRIQCALLRRGVQDKLLPNVAILEEELGRLERLSDRVRLYLSSKVGPVEDFNVTEYLKNYVQRYGDRVSIDSLCDDDPMLTMDRTLLDQILDNLVTNAFESMEGLEGLSEEKPAISCRSTRSGRIQFSVADRGKGISDADGERIFDLFYTTKNSGSGLGLALGRRFALLFGGTLTHHKRDGGGTVFVLDLPKGKGKHGR